MKSIIVQTKQEAVKIMLEDVYYIISHPSRPHYIRLVSKEGNYDFPQKLQSLEKAYPEDLVRCHRNCLVNLSMIKSINL